MLVAVVAELRVVQQVLAAQGVVAMEVLQLAVQQVQPIQVVVAEALTVPVL
jgi:hypothetical protein